MNDIDAYCSRMRKSVCEKLFFLDRDEFKNCNTIIDFGCADGSLISEMKQIFPQKTYIGVDNNPNMRKLANSKLDGSVKIYRNLQEIKEVCTPVGVILSSVLHEVFTFYSNKKIRELLTEIASISDFVFVRDMLSPSSYVSQLSIYSVNRRNVEKHPLWWSFYKKWGNFTIGTDFISVRDAMHFFLKSKYENNWRSENKENYFSVDWSEIKYIFYSNMFQCSYKNDYTNQFIKSDIMERFNFKVEFPTHRQMILQRKIYIPQQELYAN